MTESNSSGKGRFPRAFGSYLVVLGLSHFVAPGPWDVMTRLVANRDVRRWTYGFGAFETAMGALVLGRHTRVLGYLLVVVQGGFLLIRRRAVLRAASWRDQR